MKKTEYERKRMLSREDYDALCGLLGQLPASDVTQINHYYDTPGGRLRAENTTVRIRDINGRLRGTVKRHGKDGCSTEEPFRTDRFPEWLELDGEMLERRGSLTTRRKSYRMPDGLLLMLDENLYLGKSDYELEIEHPADKTGQAEGVLLCLQALTGHPFPKSETKSERFFRRLEVLNADPFCIECK